MNGQKIVHQSIANDDWYMMDEMRSMWLLSSSMLIHQLSNALAWCRRPFWWLLSAAEDLVILQNIEYTTFVFSENWFSTSPFWVPIRIIYISVVIATLQCAFIRYQYWTLDGHKRTRYKRTTNGWSVRLSTHWNDSIIMEAIRDVSSLGVDLGWYISLCNLTRPPL